jgi:ABC-type transport system substrate-binding protein
VLKDAFKKISVDMSIDKQTPAVFAEGLNTNKDQAWLRSLLWYLDDPGYVGHAFYACDSLLNWMHYCNKKVDAAVDEMIGLPASEKGRKQQLATEMQNMIVDEAPTLMLGEPRFQIAMRDDIQGYVSLPDDLMDYTALSRGPKD